MARLRAHTQSGEDDLQLAHRPKWTSEEGNETPHASYSISLPNIHLTPGLRAGVGGRRLQRQPNIQPQSSKSHARDVKASLIEDMIMTNSQCVFHEADSRQSPSMPQPELCDDLVVDPMAFDEDPPTREEDVDEGFHEEEEFPSGEKLADALVYRRACPWAGTGKPTTADCVPGTNNLMVGGKALVRSTPRMRKKRRRPPRAPE